ncbi:MBL fold metallo-hydrolase (plasmid) [Deinococcus taeanensis]|uniref:MBL fold metallo-hydrolase n=1 Tax=Deinococcus taeanensis TaxID=2737050 RepID=UPI001CDC9DCF|nr:MBL fold metallo-hydrolase [Deinococcus taeanensis]UBV45423.1 MBL fold metallo-hydrolase [Deinococcus taeanensis]
MRLQLIRNATLRLTYAGQTLLIDPSLAELHSQPALAGRSLNPTVPLPMPAQDVIQGVELVLVSHLHRDHIDLAPPQLPTSLPVVAQPHDEAALHDAGFTAVLPLHGELSWRGLHITRTAGQHGTGPVGQAMGKVCGFVLRAEGEPTVYIAGDTIWTDEVRAVIGTHHPDVIVTNSGGAQFQGTLIIMDTEQTLAVAAAAPQATVIAVHLEAYDHMTVTRDALRAAAGQAGLDGQLLVPDDGAVIDLH